MKPSDRSAEGLTRKQFFDAHPEAHVLALEAAKAARWKTENFNTTQFLKKSFERGDFTREQITSLKSLAFFETLSHYCGDNGEKLVINTEKSNLFSKIISEWKSAYSAETSVSIKTDVDPIQISMPLAESVVRYNANPEKYIETLRNRSDLKEISEKNAILYDYLLSGYNAEIILAASSKQLATLMRQSDCPVPVPIYRGFLD